VRRVWQLLKLQPQLREERAARAFLLHQLRVIEQPTSARRSPRPRSRRWPRR
jgi:hypothetical protein